MEQASRVANIAHVRFSPTRGRVGGRLSWARGEDCSWPRSDDEPAHRLREFLDLPTLQYVEQLALIALELPDSDLRIDLLDVFAQSRQHDLRKC